MAKIYAIRTSDGHTQIVNSWPECQKITSGVPNVAYKSFPSEEQAQAWFKKFLPIGYPPGIAEVYTDGSYMDGRTGWAFVVVENGGCIHDAYGEIPTCDDSHNIAGEIEAATRALKWAAKAKKEIVIRHDYIGLVRFVEGTWEARSEIAQQFLQAYHSLPVKAYFHHVAGHSGNEWNDRADMLAKRTISAI